MDTGDFVLTGGHCGQFNISKFTKDNDITIHHKITLNSNITCAKIYKLYAIIGSVDGTTRIFNSVTGNELVQFNLPQNTQVEHLAVSKEEAKLIVLGHNYFQIIDLNDGKIKFEQKVSEEFIEVSSVNAKHNLALITFWNGEIKTLNLNTAKFNCLSTPNDESAICSDIDDTTLRGVTGGTEGTVYGWNLSTG